MSACRHVGVDRRIAEGRGLQERALRLIDLAVPGERLKKVGSRGGVADAAVCVRRPPRTGPIGIDTTEARARPDAEARPCYTMIKAAQFEKPGCRYVGISTCRQRGARRLRAILSSVLVCADLPPQSDSDTAARDVLAIITGMVDAAGEHGEQDRDALGARAPGRLRRSGHRLTRDAVGSSVRAGGDRRRGRAHRSTTTRRCALANTIPPLDPVAVEVRAAQHRLAGVMRGAVREVGAVIGDADHQPRGLRRLTPPRHRRPPARSPARSPGPSGGRWPARGAPPRRRRPRSPPPTRRRTRTPRRRRGR